MRFEVGQDVAFEYDDHIDVGQRTGTIMSANPATQQYIVRLDKPYKGNKAVVLDEQDRSLQAIKCHWCRDTRKTGVTPFTMVQYSTHRIPTKECPYCVEQR